MITILPGFLIFEVAGEFTIHDTYVFPREEATAAGTASSNAAKAL